MRSTLWIVCLEVLKRVSPEELEEFLNSNSNENYEKT